MASCAAAAYLLGTSNAANQLRDSATSRRILQLPVTVRQNCASRCVTARSSAKSEAKPEEGVQLSQEQLSEGGGLDESGFPDLQKAVEQSAESTCQFLLDGGKRAIVEIAMEELDNFDVDGAQQQRWDCSMLFVKLVQNLVGGNKQIKAIFPDMGVAAAIKYQWADETTIKFGSLNDRRPVQEEDDIVILLSPDYQMVEAVRNIAYSLVDDNDEQRKPLIMWNPQLFSGDVGVGLNIRRLRAQFISTFTTVYSLETLPAGTVYRRYPGAWKIYVEDQQNPGRFVFISEAASKPNMDALNTMTIQRSGSGNSDSESPSSPSLLANAMATISSFGRFVKSLSQ